MPTDTQPLSRVSGAQGGDQVKKLGCFAFNVHTESLILCNGSLPGSPSDSCKVRAAVLGASS